MFVDLVWLTSNHMFGSPNFGDKSPFWFLKILKLASFYRAISKFSKMHSGNLSQIALPNIWLLVLIFDLFFKNTSVGDHFLIYNHSATFDDFSILPLESKKLLPELKGIMKPIDNDG